MLALLLALTLPSHAFYNDADQDGVPDLMEDVDGDGNPANDDTDFDGIPNFLDADDDGDTIPTLEEDRDGNGQPADDDTDGDGLPDYLDVDSDDDLLSDLDEVNQWGTDPANPDTDAGGVPDGEEVFQGTDPLDASDDVGPPTPLMLQSPLPGVHSAANAFYFSHADPGAQVVLFEGGQGTTVLQACQGITINVQNPAVRGSAVASPYGDGWIVVNVGPNRAGTIRGYQAVQTTTCTKSPRVPVSW